MSASHYYAEERERRERIANTPREIFVGVKPSRDEVLRALSAVYGSDKLVRYEVARKPCGVSLLLWFNSPPKTYTPVELPESRVCACGCGRPFKPRLRKQLYRSTTCRRRGWKRAHREAVRAHVRKYDAKRVR